MGLKLGECRVWGVGQGGGGEVGKNLSFLKFLFPPPPKNLISPTHFYLKMSPGSGKNKLARGEKIPANFASLEKEKCPRK
jgi:hypothetical protein